MTALAGVPARRIVAAIADAAERWSDADFPPRVRLLDRIVERTGYALPVVEYALDQLFFSITRPSLVQTIESELGTIEALDRFVERGDTLRAHAAPLGRACIISSRTTIGVAIVPAVFALCAKCDVVVKDREDDLVRTFFESLGEELDEFRDAARASVWAHGDPTVDLSNYDAVVAFGTDETMTAVQSSLRPATRFIPFGSKASIGYAGREALNPAHLKDLTAGAARDLVLYETEGCLSLHALFVERGGALEPAAVAEAVASAVERISVEFPAGARTAGMAARIASTRNLAAFRSASGTGAVFSDESASYLAVLDAPLQEAPPFLPRTLVIHAVDGPADALAYVRQHRLPIEAVAIAAEREDIVNMAIDMGAARLTRFGELQRPPLGETHGGRPRIAEFVRWITKES